MSEKPPVYQREAFNKNYFSSGTYEKVTFGRFSQYWFSNRFYAGLARRFGPAGGKILEVGCGLGHLLGMFPENYELFGTDVNEWALEQASHNVKGGHFLLTPAEDLGVFADRSFSIVITKHVVEHLADPAAAVAEMSRVLLPGGLLVFVTPNLSSRMRNVKKEHWIGYRDQTHISLKKPEAWLDMICTNHLLPVRIFSDGFWDAPYIPLIPTLLQKLFFGGPGGLQALIGGTYMPITWGESLIVLAHKEA
jgi:2-polyprenyl-3-methyl-5-hydroxy-6-metoxy-1,4-benzoquinol methylase